MPATKAKRGHQDGAQPVPVARDDGLAAAPGPRRAAGWCGRSAGWRSSSPRRTAPAARAPSRCSATGRKTSSERSAKGRVSGSDSRMVMGCSQRLELRRQDQVHEDEGQPEGDERSSSPCRPISLRRPSGLGRVARRQLQVGDGLAPAPSSTVPAPVPGAALAVNVHLALAVEAVDCARGPRPCSRRTTSVSGTVPSSGRGHGEQRAARPRVGAERRSARSAHVVDCCRPPRRWRPCTPPTQQLQRGGHVGHLHAQVGGALAIDVRRHLGLADDQVGVDVDRAGDGLELRPRAWRRTSSAPSKSGPVTTILHARPACRRR